MSITELITESIDDALPAFIEETRTHRRDAGAATDEISSDWEGEWDSLAIDDILDHLARGEAYAEHGVTAMYAQHAREVSDVTDAFGDMGTEAYYRSQGFSDSERFQHQRFRGAVYVPKMTAGTKVMVTTVLVLLSVFAVLSALTAYAMTYMTAAIRGSYTDSAPSVEVQPVSTAVLLSEPLFKQMVEQYPEQIVSLYLKRAAALQQEQKWLAAIAAFKSAELHSARPIPVSDQLIHVQCLIGARQIDAALDYLNHMHFDAMSPSEQAQANELLGRLHFATE